MWATPAVCCSPPLSWRSLDSSACRAQDESRPSGVRGRRRRLVTDGMRAASGRTRLERTVRSEPERYAGPAGTGDLLSEGMILRATMADALHVRIARELGESVPAMRLGRIEASPAPDAVRDHHQVIRFAPPPRPAEAKPLIEPSSKHPSRQRARLANSASPRAFRQGV